MANSSRNSSQTVRSQKEVPIAILQWQGMKSAMPLTAIPVGALSYSLNMDYFNLNTLQSRAGTRLWNPATLAGSNAAVGCFEYSASGSTTSTGLKATANGKLLSFSTTIVAADVLIGSITTTSVLRRVKFAQLLDKVYIADGFNAWEWDPGGGLVSMDKAVLLGIDPTAKVISVMQHQQRIWFLCSGGLLISSATNDPTDFTTVATWDGQVGRGDGMENSNFISWYDDILITKENSTTKKSSMYRMTGTTPSTYAITSLANNTDMPIGFLGDSACLVGNDVIGLTRGGFSTATSINTFAEVQLSTESADIRDFIRRINFDRADLATGIYDPLTQQYLCACPIDAADYNNIVFVFDVANSRWGLYDGWKVSTFYMQSGKTFYGGLDGTIVQTGYGYADQGGGYRKIIETGNIHLDTPDIIKLFKSVDVDIAQNGSYNVNVTPVLDDQDLAATAIPVSIEGGTEWDVFTYDEDPYDVIPSTKRTLTLLKRGKMMRLRFSNENADEPFALRSLTIRALRTDAGQMQLST